MGIEDIHGVFRTSMQILACFSADQGVVLLRKENRRIDGVGLVVETRRFIGREIAGQDVGRHGLRDVLEIHGSGSDTEYISIPSILEGLTIQIGKGTSSACTRLTEDNLHSR